MLKLPKISLVAFDPGKQTGVVWIGYGEFQYSQTYNYHDLRGVIQSTPFTTKPVWVCEDFVVRPQYSTPLSDRPSVAARVIGMLDLVVHGAGNELVLQSPSNVKKFANDQMLDHVGWLSLTRNNHERDAARHALFYLANQKRRGG